MVRSCENSSVERWWGFQDATLIFLVVKIWRFVSGKYVIESIKFKQTLLMSPNQAIFNLRLLNISLRVIKSAKVWHGCDKSDKALIIGFWKYL